MTGASYIPGTWLGVVRSRTAVLLGPGLPAELAGAVWELLAGRPEPHEVLAAVTSGSGGSLTQLPSFGILDFNGPLRVFLRGDIDLTVEQPGGPVDLDGRDVTTWNERKFVVPGRCRLGIASGGTGSGHSGEHRELPLGEGVVLLQSLTLGVPSGPAAVRGPAAADSTAARNTSPSADGTFAVNTAGVVDGQADSDSEGTASVVSPGAGLADAGSAAAAAGSAGDSHSETEETAAASSGTVVGVVEDEPNPEPGAGPEGRQAGDESMGPVPGESFDPDATIAPGAIIDIDGELAVDAAGTGPEHLQAEAGGAAAADSSGPDGKIADVDAAGAKSARPASAARDQAEAAFAAETTSSYDHLWDRTVMRNIEDAAVREEPDADSGHVLPQQQAALAAAEPLHALGTGDAGTLAGPEGAAHSGAGDSAASGPGADTGSPAGSGPGGYASTQPDPAQPDPAQPDPAQPDSARPDPPRARPASPGLIDSVPWRTGGATPAPAGPRMSPSVGTPPAPFAPDVPSAPDASSMAAPSGPHTASSPASHTPAGNAGSSNEQGQGFDPDHDGQTVLKGSLPGAPSGLAPGGPTAGGAVPPQDAPGGPLVLARVCAQGHPNPPTRAQCSVCGSALLPDAVQVARPRLGRMRLSTGELLDLDESMVIGRQPSVSRVQGGVMPRLVQVASPGGDISRSHVEVRLEGWHVMLCDLKATNGTVLVREGQPPRRLAQNEMAILLDGDIAELGDNISMRFEEIP